MRNNTTPPKANSVLTTLLNKKVIGGIVAGIIGITVLVNSAGKVEEGFAGIKRTNGAAVSYVEPGLYFTIPFFQDVVLIETRSKVVTWEKLMTYTKDQQPVAIKFSIQVSLDPKSALDLYKQYGTQIIEKTVFPSTERSVKDTFGQYNAIQIVQTRDHVGTAAYNAVKSNVNVAGVKVEEVNIQNFDFSDEYEKMVEQRMLEEVQVAKAHQTRDREAVQNEITVNRAIADQKAAQAKSDAAAYDLRKRGEAEADAIRARSTALRESPQLIELVKAEKWDGKLPTTMPPGSSVPFINVK